jgi:hypothetical protein
MLRKSPKSENVVPMVTPISPVKVLIEYELNISIIK